MADFCTQAAKLPISRDARHFVCTRISLREISSRSIGFKVTGKKWSIRCVRSLLRSEKSTGIAPTNVEDQIDLGRIATLRWLLLTRFGEAHIANASPSGSDPGLLAARPFAAHAAVIAPPPQRLRAD
jgi:hypothetical protein